MYKLRGADNREYGPVSADVVRQWITQRRVIAQTLLQVEGTSDWRMVADFPEFAEALAAQSPSPGVPPSPVPPPPPPSVARDGRAPGTARPTAPETSATAIASLVLGILGFFSCGITPLVGLILGFVSLSQIRSSNGRLSGRGLAIAGICLSAVFLLFTIAALLFFLPFGAAVTIPAANRARVASESAQCLNNLKQIGIAVRMWENEHNGFPPDLLTLSNQLASPNVLVCPGERLRERKRVRRWSDLNMIGSSYTYFPPARNATAQPTILVTCPIHNNVCHADGSVSTR